MKSIFLLSFVLGAISSGSASPLTDPDHNWKSEDVTKLLTLMMKYGNVELKKKNNELQEAGCRKDCIVNQFLVAAVVSEAEIKESENWQSLPEPLTNGRIIVKLNSEQHRNVPSNYKKSVHGEMLLLHDSYDIPKMIKRLHDEKKGSVYPFVVLYSHYIPCYGIYKVDYSCAQELGKEAIHNLGKYTMLVGFKEKFQNTQKDKAVKFMSLGGIKQFELSENGAFVPIKSDVSVGTYAKTTHVFQDLFYKCLDITPASEDCCTVDIGNQDYKLRKEQILSLYVNNVMLHCTRNVLNKHTGTLSQTYHNRNELVKCIHEYANGHTGNDCPYCPAQATINTIKVCALFASAFGTEVGQPENPYEPDSPKWKEGPVEWGSLYKDYNEDSDVNRPAVFCLRRPYDIKSLCTQLNVPHKDVPDRIRTLIKKIRDVK